MMKQFISLILRSLIAIVLSVMIISCIESTNNYDPSLIDRDQIDMDLGYNVSQLLLDHLYIVVDSTTYASVTQNTDWQNSYASIDTGLPDFNPSIKHASTCYLRGHQHSIEILGPNNEYNEPVGKSGVGFSLKNKGEHFHLGVEPKLRSKKDTVLQASETVKMPLDGEEHTWFKAFYTPSKGTALHTWYGFYNPDFLNELDGEYHTAYSREAFLELTYANHKLFNSIKAIRLMCTPADFSRIARELGDLRCNLIDSDGTAYTIQSGDIDVILEASEQIPYSKITQITCNLNKEDNSTQLLGNLTIKNEGKTSIWNFDQLHTNN